MEYIKSRTNKDIAQVSLLLKDRKERRARGLFVAEGVRTVRTLIESDVRLKKIYILESLIDDIQAVKDLFQQHGYRCDHLTLVTQAVIEKISDTTSPSGIVGVFIIPSVLSNEPLGDGVVLASISSPGNMGTIIRTAAALGKKTVVIVGGADVWSPKVVQATAGTIGQVTIVECAWQELLVRKKDILLCALVVQGGQAPEILGDQKALLVVGNEAHGLADEWVADCDKKITLPMPGNIESLNAALAVSIVMYVGYLANNR